MLNAIKTIYHKELIDAIRDKNAMFIMAFLVILLPVLIGILVGNLAKKTDALEQTVQVKLINQEQSSALSTYLLSHQIIPDPDARITLTLDDAFSEHIAKGDSGKITIRADLNQDADSVARIQRAVSAYNTLIASQRLFARGIPPGQLNAIDLQIENTVLNTQMAQRILSAIVYFLLIIPVIATAGIAIDSLAGERERLSLEILLLQPIDYFHLLLGKWLNLLTFALLASLSSVLITMIILHMTPLAKLGISLDLSFMNALTLVVILIPFIIMISAAQMALALYAKSFKEGQTYLTLLSFLPIFISLIPQDTLKHLSLPVALELTHIKALLLFGAIDPVKFTIVSVLEITLAFGLLIFGVSRLNKESILT